MRPNYVFAGLAVSDRTAAIDWYSRLLGQPPGMLPNDDEAAWQLTETASLYARVDPDRAGRGILTIVVEGLDQRLEELKLRGIQAIQVDVGDAGRKAVLGDPDGNRVEIVELAFQTVTRREPSSS